MGRMNPVQSVTDWREPNAVQRSKLRWRDTLVWCRPHSELLAEDGEVDPFAFDAAEQLRDERGGSLEKVTVKQVERLAARLRKRAGV